MNIKTTFAGLELCSPIIAASSSRTANIAHNIALCEAGVGAIVLKSLFEENIISQSEVLSQETHHSEGADYLHGYLRSHELSEYIELIKRCKQECSVPIIASICAITHGEWEEFARLIEEAGADALELNIMGIECGIDYEDGRVERAHEDIVRSIKAQINIPIIVKLGSLVTNPVALISRLKACGAAAVVLFNRMYSSDIDIESMEYVAGSPFSTP
ncbi:MAG: diguanylate cyclase, partial [Rikenellaceae bacterium]